jgi:ankyrin repeat protein
MTKMRAGGALRPNIHDLHHSIHVGHEEDIQDILDQNTLDINATVCGTTALSLTLYKERCPIFRLLLDHPNISRQINLNKLSKDEKQRFEPPLVTACRLGNREALRLLIENGVDLEGKDNFQHTSLWMATSQRFTDIVEYLIASGANVNPSLMWTHSPLFFAVRCSSKRTEIAKMLIHHGAEVNITKGSSLLYCAIIQGDLPIAKLIVDAGYNVPVDEKIRAEFGSGLLSRNSILLSWLDEELHIPASLQRQSRGVIRKIISSSHSGRFFLVKLQQLPLPRSIIYYLALTHNMEHIQCKQRFSIMPIPK